MLKSSIPSIAFVASAVVASALFVFVSPEALAWGRRGHQIVADVAVSLLSHRDVLDGGAPFLKQHGFDLAYYANVPDLVWKKPETYQIEWINHFMDLEVFEGQAGKAPPFELDRAAFDAAYPGIKREAGRAWWRIRELDARLEEIAVRLRALPGDAPRTDRQKLQVQWLSLAGEIGHYVGDMSQPLHCTENYDGQETGQKGLHAFYEDKVVDELYPELTVLALTIARAGQRADRARSKNMSVLQVVRRLTEGSRADLATILRLDKTLGRTDMAKAKRAYKDQIARRLAAGGLALAELWSRRLGWRYDGEKFYDFLTQPEYVVPPGPAPAR